MCGRLASEYDLDLLAEAAALDRLPSELIDCRYNIAPTQRMPIVRTGPDGQREAVWMRWGLVPFWAKDASIGNRMINARAETVAEKPAYRAAFRRRRCLIPASGFYEWQKLADSKRKQPFYIFPAGAPLFMMAGLWETWDAGDGPLETFTIITTQANDAMLSVHDRMPVILAPEAWDRWLNADERDAPGLRDLLVPAPSESIRMRPVSTLVNSPSNDDARCIEGV